MSILRKYEPDPAHVLDWADLRIEEDVSYEEKPIRVLDSREQVLRGKTIIGQGLMATPWRRGGYVGARR